MATAFDQSVKFCIQGTHVVMVALQEAYGVTRARHLRTHGSDMCNTVPYALSDIISGEHEYFESPLPIVSMRMPILHVNGACTV